MALGGETIDLLPLRNWSQLDVYKWRAQGKLPGTPAGLEITFDHVKVTGEAVLIKDPHGPAKLQKLLNEWLALERRAFELAQQKAHAKPASVEQEPAGWLRRALSRASGWKLIEKGRCTSTASKGKILWPRSA